MEKAVFILGAGASAPFGVPTLRHIFKNVHARNHLQKDQFLREKLKEIFWEPRGHSLESSHESLTVEDILTIVRDYENKKYDVPSPLEGNLDRFRRSLYVLIKKAIYDGKSSDGRHLNPVIDFASSNFSEVTWASFNWDCIFEASYYYWSGVDRYDRVNPRVVVKLQNWYGSGGGHVFLKLHGGINWWYESGGLVYLPFGHGPDLNARWKEYENGTHSGHPVILEPSFYKYEDPMYDHLKPQWDYFVQSLIDADIVVVIGYSLPESDAEARTSLLTGFQASSESQYVVINNSENVCDRYGRLFGNRRLRTYRTTLEDATDHLEDMILGF